MIRFLRRLKQETPAESPDLVSIGSELQPAERPDSRLLKVPRDFWHKYQGIASEDIAVLEKKVN